MKKSFLIYLDWGEIFNSLTDAQTGKLLKAMLAHTKGEKVELSPKLSLLFITFRQQLDRNLQNYEKKVEAYRENANKRWQKIRKDTTVSNGMQSHAMAYGKVKDKVKDKDIYKENKTEQSFSSYKEMGKSNDLDITSEKDNKNLDTSQEFSKAGLDDATRLQIIKELNKL